MAQCADINKFKRAIKRQLRGILKDMVTDTKTESAAVRCWIEARRVCLELADGRFLSFPASKYPLLARAPQDLLEKVTLRLGGLALRWETLDEDKCYTLSASPLTPPLARPKIASRMMRLSSAARPACAAASRGGRRCRSSVRL